MAKELSRLKMEANIVEIGALTRQKDLVFCQLSKEILMKDNGQMTDQMEKVILNIKMARKLKQSL